MPYIKVQISERALSGLQSIERQAGGTLKDAVELTEVAVETLGNLLAYDQENKNRGKTLLVTQDEGRRNYRRHTSLNVIIPFHLLK